MLAILKRYIIHILSVKVLSLDTLDLPEENFALIVVSDDLQIPALGLCKKDHLLRLSFEDVGEHNPNACSEPDAKTVLAFLKALPATVTDLYICCDYGESRSPAIAAAVLLASGRSDSDVWDNPYYHPNALVFSVFCRAFGIALTETDIFGRIQRNEQALRDAINHIPGKKYEKWQLLF